MDKKNLGIPKDALVSIKVSGAFYQNLQQLLYLIAEQKSVDEFAKAVAKIKDNPPSDTYEFQIATVLGVIFEIENCAKEQNLLKEVELPKSDDSSPEVEL
jgi:hypothetical protein